MNGIRNLTIISILLFYCSVMHGEVQLTQQEKDVFIAIQNRKNDQLKSAIMVPGIDVNKIRGRGMTPLGYAVFKGNEGAVDILLAAKANVNSQEQIGEIAQATMLLDIAKEKNNAAIINKLVQAGARGTGTDAERIDLYIALLKRDIPKIKDLLGRGINLSIPIRNYSDLKAKALKDVQYASDPYYIFTMINNEAPIFMVAVASLIARPNFQSISPLNEKEARDLLDYYQRNFWEYKEVLYSLLNGKSDIGINQKDKAGKTVLKYLKTDAQDYNKKHQDFLQSRVQSVIADLIQGLQQQGAVE